MAAIIARYFYQDLSRMKRMGQLVDFGSYLFGLLYLVSFSFLCVCVCVLPNLACWPF
jgi:hypothetical protein